MKTPQQLAADIDWVWFTVRSGAICTCHKTKVTDHPHPKLLYVTEQAALERLIRAYLRRWVPKNVTKLRRAANSRLTTLANPGYCVICGKRHNNCEPDASYYTCTKCKTPSVFGAEELLQYV